MADGGGGVPSPARRRRLSQLLDPLNRLAAELEHHQPGPSSLPASPRLIRSRTHGAAPLELELAFGGGGPSTSAWYHHHPHHAPATAPAPATATASGHLSIDWHERCVQLQLELHRFRHQAGRVRDMLNDKLSELELRVVEAETRADEAEHKVRMMEQRLGPGEWNASEPEISKEKQTVINKLETQVEEQRQLRLQDAKQVEAKAAKIKEWVTNKLRELEEQNQHLREQNQKCNAQLELLRNHLAASQLVKDRCSTAASSSRASLSLDVTTTSEDSLTLPPSDLPARPLSASLRRCSTSAGSLETSGPLYAEVDRERKQQLRQEAGHRRHLSSAGAAGGALMDPRGLLSQELHAAVEGLCLTSSAIAGPSPAQRISSGDEGAHDYAEIYTPSREKQPWLTSLPGHRELSQGGSTSSTTSGSLSLEVVGGPPCKPPTPPLHRFPSWESRIYQVAQEGLAPPPPGPSSSHHHHPHHHADSSNNNKPHHGYCDISVPVYATVKGRASQIRSMPFTGDSSDDSSEGEGEHLAIPNSSSDHTDTSRSSGSSPSKSVKTTSSLSPAKRSSTGSSPSKPAGNKRGQKQGISSAFHTSSFMNRVGDTSIESGMSDDYAIPPDAVSCSDATSVDASMPSLLMRVSGYMDSPRRAQPSPHPAAANATATTSNTNTASSQHHAESLEKAGPLAKLGGKLKTWRKRWFVLRNGVLSYWKTQNDINRKPQGEIALDEMCRITRADGAATFEISTGKKTYYLTADSLATVEEWIRVLQNVQRRNATRLLLSSEDHKPTIQGWLTKVKNGHAKRCWCVLLGKMFLYFKAPGETTPVGQINMRDARVEEVDHMSDSDSEDREPDGQGASELTIGIFPTHQGPTYLLMPGKHEKDTWLYHLTVVSGGGPSAGTQYEQLVQKLMETDGDPNCVLWKHPHLLHSKESISSPLTSLTTETIQSEAIKLFKSCQLFMSVAIDSRAGIDYHVVLAQNALQQCLQCPELQPELICALVKQTSRHTHTKLGVQQLLLCATQSLFACDASGIGGGGGGGGGGMVSACASSTQSGSPTSLQASPAPECKTNPAAFVLIQGWQLLALAVSLFVPKNNRLLWYLKLHLARNADSKTEGGKYAAYCERAVERTIQCGGRDEKPSRMEVLSILLKNPYHHSLPHAIPVHMLNGTYQVVSFDGSTSIEEFVSTLNAELGCREAAVSGFTLFSDDPIEKDLEHYLEPGAKLCDVISKWETALREKGSGKFENTRVIQLTYKNRLYWRHAIKTETDRERVLLCYQTNQQIIHGRFPLNRELALELAALMAQIDMGEYNSEKGRGSGSGGGNPHHQVLQALDKFYPYRYKDGLTPEELKDLQERLTEKWSWLRGRSCVDCVRIYLTCARKWPLFGAGLFQAREAAAGGAVVWLAVAEDSLSVLELASMAPIATHPYSSVVTFGGCQDDFMLVVVAPDEGAPPQKFIFSLNKPKILELTLLIADYMNALGTALPGTPQMGSLTRNGSHRSVRPRQTTIAAAAAAAAAAHHAHAAATATTATSTAHNTLTSLGGATSVGAGSDRLHQQPDILKSTPEHQAEAVRLHRSDSKKRNPLDGGLV